MKFEKISKGLIYDSVKSRLKLDASGPRCTLFSGNGLWFKIGEEHD